MSTFTKRGAAIAAAGALSAGVLAFVAPAAQAAGPVTPGATLTWGISQYTNGNGVGTFTLPVAAAPATFADSAVTFVEGTGRTDTSTYATTVSYQGSVRIGSSHGYSIDLSDPTVSIDADGDGVLAADVSWDVAAQGSAPASTGHVDDVPLTTFTRSDTTWSGFSFTAQPSWEAVASSIDVTGADGSPATLAPVDGKAWSPEFIRAIPSSVRAFFYASGTTASNALKAPASFTAEVPGPATSLAVTAATASSVTLGVRGEGFTAVTNPGDAGVYVGVAESGGLPPVATREDMDEFVAANPVFATSFPSGAFTSSVTLPLAELDRATNYSVYTWQAHSHSNTSQDTETPITWDTLLPAASASISGARTVGATLRANVTGWPAVPVSYQWRAAGVPIAGATGATLLLTPALVGRAVSVSATATIGALASRSATSTAVVVAPGTLAVAKPKTAGKAKVGKKLTAKVTVPAGAAAKYQWFAGTKKIKGATKKTLKLKKAQKGKKVSVTVTITRAGFATVVKKSAAVKVKR